MRRLIATLAALSLLAYASGAAAGVRNGSPQPPSFPDLPGSWSHAEINVTIKKQPHTLILDRGRVLQASQQQLVLRRGDGTTATISVSPATVVTPRRFTLASIRRGLFAETMIVDDGPAVRVNVSLRP